MTYRNPCTVYQEVPDWPEVTKYLCMARHTNRVTELREGELTEATKDDVENDLPIGDIDEDDHEVCSTVTRRVRYLVEGFVRRGQRVDDAHRRLPGRDRRRRPGERRD